MKTFLYNENQYRSPQLKRYIKDNNVFMWNVLNSIAYNLDDLKTKMPTALYMQLLNKHLKHSDAKTGQHDDIYAEKLWFLYKQLIENPNAKLKFETSSLFMALTKFFIGNCSDLPPWNQYKHTETCSKEYLSRNAITAAFRSYRFDENSKLALDTRQLIDLFVQGDGSSEHPFELRDTLHELTEEEQQNIYSAVTETIKTLRSTKDFRKNYYEAKENIYDENENA